MNTTVADSSKASLRLRTGHFVAGIMMMLILTGLSTPALAASQIFTEDFTTPDGSSSPTRFAFRAAQPNPFGLHASLVFDLPAVETVELMIYDAAGRQMRVLASGVHRARRYHISWDGRNEDERLLAPGVYFARIRAGSFEESRQLVRIR